jgi:hypothetical protein
MKQWRLNALNNMPPVYRPIQDGAAFSKQYVGESVAVAI